jgi:hypothetical protein
MPLHIAVAIPLAFALATATPARAQLPDIFAMTTDPADREVMTEAAAAVSGQPPNLAQLDMVLAKLPRPTPLRGMIQAVRADLLGNSDIGAAVAAVDEALRLLPDDPRPKMIATGVFTFSGAPQRAADLWLQVSRDYPDIARRSSRYLMSALVGRLNDAGDRTRADRVRARMAEIGFSGGLGPERSASALARVREAVRSDRADEARGLIPAISNPDDLRTLYIDRRYASLWGRIAEWAGPDLGAQTKRYLEELQLDWAAAGDFKTAVPYARALAELDAHEQVVTLFLPSFDRLRAGDDIEEMEFLAPIVARSLSRLGRDAEADELIANVRARLSSAPDAQELNLDGALIRRAVDQMDWPRVVSLSDKFLTDARALGPLVNQSATLAVAGWRACGLWGSGQIAEAERATAEIVLTQSFQPEAALQALLCRGDARAARTLLQERMKDENTRTWALATMQPRKTETRTPFGRWIQPRHQAVTTVPELIALAQEFGRILPGPVNSSLPTDFDPLRARPRLRPLRPDET